MSSLDIEPKKVDGGSNGPPRNGRPETEESILEAKKRLANRRRGRTNNGKRSAPPVAAQAPASSGGDDIPRGGDAGGDEGKEEGSILDEKRRWANRRGKKCREQPKKLVPAVHMSSGMSADDEQIAEAAGIGIQTGAVAEEGGRRPGDSTEEKQEESLLATKYGWATRRGRSIQQNGKPKTEESILEAKQRLANRRRRANNHHNSSKPTQAVAAVSPAPSSDNYVSRGSSYGGGEEEKQEVSILEEKRQWANRRGDKSRVSKCEASSSAAGGRGHSKGAKQVPEFSAVTDRLPDSNDDRSSLGRPGRPSDELSSAKGARPEMVPSTAPGARAFIDSSRARSGSVQPSAAELPVSRNGRASAIVGGRTDDNSGAAESNPGDDGLRPGAFAVAGPVVDEEGGEQSSAPSFEEPTPPILEGTLAGSQSRGGDDLRRADPGVKEHCVNEPVYDGVALPSDKDAGGGNRWRWLKKLLVIVALLCLMGGITAVAVTLTRRNTPSSTEAPVAAEPVSFAPSPSPSPTPSPTPKPSYHPTLSRAEENELKITKLAEFIGENVRDASAPYVNATRWLLIVDPMQLRWDDPSLMQRYILALLYYSTGGDSWRRKRFLTREHECNWAGIGCNGEDNLTSITMAKNNMFGTLPTELSLLPLLERLDFSRNGLSGTIPIEIGQLTNLKELHLFANGKSVRGTPKDGFSGSLPPSIGNISSLEVLSLSNNTLKGTLPTEFYYLNSLTRFYCGYNKLSGTISTAIGSLARLEEFNIEGNSFAGPLPPEIGDLVKLKALIIGGTSVRIDGISIDLSNDFTGSIPSTIGRLTSLERIDLSLNELGGALPDEFYNLERLTSFACYGISISGTISTLIGRLTKLKTLNMANNDLSGSLPEELYGLDSLTLFDCSYNSLSGTISTLVGRLTNLEVLRLGLPLTRRDPRPNNELSGSLPDEFYSLDSLVSFHCSSQSLSGTISTLIGQLTNLEHFKIDRNSFTGTIPAELAQLKNMKEIEVQWNDFNGTVSEDFCDLDQLWLLAADCGPGHRPPIECACCTYCSNTAFDMAGWQEQVPLSCGTFPNSTLQVCTDARFPYEDCTTRVRDTSGDTDIHCQSCSPCPGGCHTSVPYSYNCENVADELGSLPFPAVQECDCSQ